MTLTPAGSLIGSLADSLVPLPFLLALALAVLRPRAVMGVRWAALILVVAALWVPLGGVSAALYVKSVLGAPSTTTIVLVADALVRRFSGIGLFGQRDRPALFGGIALVGLIFYSCTLGIVHADPYRLGFRPFALSAAILGLAILAACLRPALAVPLLLAVLSFELHPGPSSNLWNHLIDPAVTLYACGWCCARAIPGFRKRNSEPPPRAPDSSSPESR